MRDVPSSQGSCTRSRLDSKAIEPHPQLAQAPHGEVQHGQDIISGLGPLPPGQGAVREQCAHAANCEAGTGKLPWPMSPELSPCGPGSDVKH